MEIYQGDCLEVSKNITAETVDLVYLDPPFFTQKKHKLTTKDRTKQFSFDDVWKSLDDYADFLFVRLQEFHRVLSPAGSIFFHCDSNASHIARLLLDRIFGREMLRAEIIWHYRRWSNAQKNLLPSHQTIYFYSKTPGYKFNRIYGGYSPATNVDQILQKRKRDEFGKSVYATDENGNHISNGNKKGVPMSDVWDIPFLNPKAKERTGYPTQKPILLLERIIQISTAEGDCVLDPFCGSGTTLVAAKLLGRNAVGIDISPEAVELTRTRLENPSKTTSNLMEVGRETYRNANEQALVYLNGLNVVPVHRNSGIDALLQTENANEPIPIRVQRNGESLTNAARSLWQAAKNKNVATLILVATEVDSSLETAKLFPEIVIVNSTASAVNTTVETLFDDQNSRQQKKQKCAE